MITLKQSLVTDAALDDYLSTISIKNFRVELDELLEERSKEIGECERIGATMAMDFLAGNEQPLVAVTDDRISRK